MMILLFFTLCFTQIFCEQICPGIAYERLQEPESIHLLRIDPHLIEIRPVHALNLGFGRESLVSISKRVNAVAAINAGFFASDGRPAGILKIDGQWLGLPKRLRGAIGWSHNQKPLFDRLRAHATVKLSDHMVNVPLLNCARGPSDVVLYSWAAQRSTLTSPEGTEVIIRKKRIKKIVHEQGDTLIPKHGWVLSFGEKVTLPTILKGMPVGIRLEVEPHIAPDDCWDGVDHIVGGAGLLIKNGEDVNMAPENTCEAFRVKKHARTAIGLLPNGHWVIVVVDGLPPERGMTIDELKCYMHSLGCTDALNLDGGSSSMMTIRSEVVNTPHLKEKDDGKIADALVFIAKM